MYASVTVLGRFHSLPPCHTGCCHSCHQVSHATDAAPRCQIGCQRRPSTCLTCTRVCHACIAMQLNERVLSSSSSYPLRVLHTSFAAGSKIDLHHNFTKKTYERDGVLRLMCVPDHALLASRRDALVCFSLSGGLPLRVEQDLCYSSPRSTAITQQCCGRRLLLQLCPGAPPQCTAAVLACRCHQYTAQMIHASCV